MSARAWTYAREEWDPPKRWLPYRGGDEHGRRTIVLPIPFGGYAVVAYRTCHCRDCVVTRLQTYYSERSDDCLPAWIFDWAAETRHRRRSIRPRGEA